MTDIKNCWAYNTSKQRCDMPAGHPGDHSITMSWSDEECYDPTSEVTLTVREYGPLIPVNRMGIADGLVPPPMENDSDECLICEHKMHRGMCPLPECECKNGIAK